MNKTLQQPLIFKIVDKTLAKMNSIEVMKILSTKDLKRKSWLSTMRGMEKNLFESSNLELLKLHSVIKSVLNKLQTEEVVIAESDAPSETFGEDVCFKYIELFSTASEIVVENDDKKNKVNITPNK